MTDRSWYRLHWATWLAAACVLAAVMSANVVHDGGNSRVGGLNGGTFEARTVTFLHGWPWRCVDREESWTSRFTATNQFHWRPAGLFGDVGVALAMLVGTVAAVERWRRGRWRQFSLLGLFVSTWTIAALIILYQARGVDYAARDDPSDVVSSLGIVYWIPWYVSVPLVFGLACTLQSVGWLVVWASARALQAVGKRGHPLPTTPPPEAVPHE